MDKFMLAKNGKKYLLIFLLIFNFLAQANLAYAQTYSGVDKEITKYLCAPPANNAPASPTILFDCINQIYKFALVICSVVAVLFIVLAGFRYMSAEGSQETVDKAKDMIVTSISALVILFAGYILLKTLNPDLVQFKSIQPPSVTLQPAIPESSSPVAQGLLTNPNITVSDSGSCPGNNPKINLQDVSRVGQAVFDGPGTICNAGKTNIDTGMLQTLTNIGNKNLKITITSLTSGHHSGANDPHYAGRAVDFVPADLNQGQQILNTLVAGGTSKVAVECTLNGAAQFILIYPASATNANKCQGMPNYHWHAQWSGVSGNVDPNEGN